MPQEAGWLLVPYTHQAKLALTAPFCNFSCLEKSSERNLRATALQQREGEKEEAVGLTTFTVMQCNAASEEKTPEVHRMP